MRIFLLITAFFLTLTTFSQQLKREINWKSSIITNDNTNNIYMMNFDGADYPDLDFLLPYFYERIPLDNYYIYVNPKLERTIFVECTNDDLKNIKNLDKLTREIEIKSTIEYERKKPFLKISFIPLRINSTTGKIEKLVSFSLNISDKRTGKPVQKLKDYAQESVLSNGTWVKIKLSSDGVYKLSYDDLSNMGLGNPANVAVFGNAEGMLPYATAEDCYNDLVENPIYMQKGSDGIFNSGDFILFYGKGPTKNEWDTADNMFLTELHDYSDYSYYFVTDKGSTKSIQNIPSTSNPNVYVNSFDGITYHEAELKNLIRSGRNWLGESFDIVTEQSFSFSLPNLITSEAVKTMVATSARYSTTSSFTLKANNQSLATINHSAVNMSSEYSTHAHENNALSQYFSSSDNIIIDVIYNKPDPEAEAWLDYIVLNGRRQLKMYGSQLLFRDNNSVGAGNISQFTLSNASPVTLVWDVTDPRNPLRVETTFSGSSLTFTLSTDSLREFVAFNSSDYKIPEIVGLVVNQNLHGVTPPDMVIVSHPNFLSQANRLADFHRSQDAMDVLVVTPEQIYNEFSSGSPDVSAIRNFMKMFYDRSTSEEDMPNYLLLFGDGSYDNRSTDPSNTNYILTYQSVNSLKPTSSFVTDDYFALLDDTDGITSGLMDLGVGRLTVKTLAEATTVVDKIVHYATSPDCFGDWRNMLCFIGDDEDGNQHMGDADKLATYIDTTYNVFNIEKIYLDAYVQISTPGGARYPDVNIAINNRVQKGALIINYTGHGGELGLGHEDIIGVNQINNWSGYNNMPLFMTATCEFSRFDDYERTSAGEMILLNPEGGGIGLLSTTRVVYASSNFILNSHFYRTVFETDANGERYRLGDIMRLTKNNSSAGINTRNFTLLCDPALNLQYPKANIVTTKINGNPISSIPDTLKALSFATLEGYITDEGGNILSDYNGILTGTIYDKYDSINTLRNDGGSPFEFIVQNKILYKGKASVTNGEFSISFIVPKDISYRLDCGKLSYYVDNTNSTNKSTGYFDASGYYRNVIIGGSSDTLAEDNEGPEIELFMNNDDFVYGGITDENPTLLAYLRDSSGINTVGNGIGHDITATVDDNSSQILVLNDHYEAGIDTYQSGQIEYNFNDIAEGTHKLHLKVWDVFNNSSEEVIEFIVAESSELILDHVFNYPNPFTTRTSFYFDHNLPNSTLDVLVQVFTVTGKLVKTINTSVNSTGFRSSPIEWDGLDDFSDPIGRGVYVYKIRVRSPEGTVVEKFEKLVILK